MSRLIQVMKFGGTSVGDAGRIRSAAAIAAEASKERAVVMVVSAMSGVTNTLIAAAGKAATGDEAACEALAKALQEKHHEAIGKLISDGEKRRELISEMLTRSGYRVLAAATPGEASSLKSRLMIP
jgi:aspartokinase